MVVLNRIYTRTGDDGTTGLGTGERRPKYDLRIETFGTIDETNATIGMARAELAAESGGLFEEIDAILMRVQNDLFDLGAELATPPAHQEPGKQSDEARLTIITAQVERLESDIDRLNVDLEPLRSFVLPGGTRAAAALHLARTVCRRAERLMVALAAQEPEKVGRPGLLYVNRLSDLLFVASRWVNGRGSSDVLWVPGKNR